MDRFWKGYKLFRRFMRKLKRDRVDAFAAQSALFIIMGFFPFFMLLLTLILTVFFCFTAAVGIGPTGTGAAKHINTGLDLAGGVSITYQAKESNPTSE